MRVFSSSGGAAGGMGNYLENRFLCVVGGRTPAMSTTLKTLLILTPALKIKSAGVYVGGRTFQAGAISGGWYPALSDGAYGMPGRLQEAAAAE